MTQGDTLGVSSAIIEMGINAERGGTAFVRLNQNMRENLDKFAKSTGIAKEEYMDVCDEFNGEFSIDDNYVYLTIKK